MKKYPGHNKEPKTGHAPLTRRQFLSRSLAGAGALALGSSGMAALANDDRKPNIVLILIDDLGWTDLGCYGSTFYQTPNVDRLAGQGMKFTQAYAAAPVCSPTRAAIMTGKHPARLHITDWIPGHYQPGRPLEVPKIRQELPLNEETIAEALKAVGYATASIGKWHLGHEPYYPDKQGFDINIAGTFRGQPPSYFYPYRNERYSIPTLQGGTEGEYLTDRLAGEAERFIEAHQDRPFFLYLSHFTVHTPIQPKPDLREKYAARTDPGQAQNNPGYAAMVQSMDESVGRVMAKLAALGLDDNTIVIFTSDNGGLSRVTSNSPLRSGKGSLYEGGIRVPTIVRWPGVAAPGSVCRVPVISMDFFPTILAAVGAKRRRRWRNPIDGRSLVPLLDQSGSLKRDALYWHYPHYHGAGPTTPVGAIIEKDYKLLEYFEDDRLELYNLKEDLGELHDLAGQRPDLTARLHQRLLTWRKSLKAQLPTPNPGG